MLIITPEGDDGEKHVALCERLTTLCLWGRELQNLLVQPPRVSASAGEHHGKTAWERRRPRSYSQLVGW